MPSQTKQGKQEEKKNSERAEQITQNKWQKTSECKTNIISEYKLNSSVRAQRLSEKIKKNIGINYMFTREVRYIKHQT